MDDLTKLSGTGQTSGITIKPGGFIAWDTTLALQHATVTPEDVRHASVNYFDGFMDPASGYCRIVQPKPTQTVVPGPNNDIITPVPHTTVEEDTGWVKGKRTLTLKTEDNDWLFDDPAQNVHGATSPKALTGEDPLYREMTITYTEGTDPVTTTKEVPVTSTVTVLENKTVSKAVTSTTGQDRKLLVQADVYGPAFRGGTWEGARKRTKTTPLTSAQRKLLARLDDDGMLKPREDMALWGSSTSQIITLTGTDEVKYGSLEQAALHKLGWRQEDATVTTVRPGQSIRKLWALGPGATSAFPFGPKLSVAQTSLTRTPSLLSTATKWVSSTVQVPVTKTVTSTKTVTTTVPGTTVAPTWSYSAGTPNN